MHCYGRVWGRHCRRLQHNSHSLPCPPQFLWPSVITAVAKSCHCTATVEPHTQLGPLPILYPCFEEDCVTAQRASPLLEPGSGNVENGNLPSLVLRSNMLPKLFSLIFQHFVLSSSVSFSLHFPGPTSLQGAANTNHSSSKVSFEPPLRQGIGTSGMTTEGLALGFQIPWFLPPGASKTDNDHNWCFCLFWLN